MNSVRTVYEPPNTNTKTSTNASTKSNSIPIVASQLVPDQAQAPDHGGVAIVLRDSPENTGYRVPDCPYAAIVDAYHRACPTLNRVEVLGTTRQAALKARWREVCAAERFDGTQGMEWFGQFFAIVAASRFLQGKVPPRHGSQQAPWRANFDWLIKPANFVKVLEGTYADHKGD